MTQNRNKLIKLFIGNISNSVVHTILEKAISDENIRKRYGQELLTSFKVAMKYREKIKPVKKNLSEKDRKYIRDKIVKKAKSELKARIVKGYFGIDLSLVKSVVDKFLKDAAV